MIAEGQAEAEPPFVGIVLKTRAVTRYLRLVRTVAASLVTDLGWTVPQTHMAGLAVTEVGAAVMAVATGDAMVEFHFAVPRGGLHSRVRVPRGARRTQRHRPTRVRRRPTSAMAP